MRGTSAELTCRRLWPPHTKFAVRFSNEPSADCQNNAEIPHVGDQPIIS